MDTARRAARGGPRRMTSDRPHGRRRRVAVPFIIACAASLICLALLNEDIRLTDQTHWEFMAWNLALAWIPVVLSLVVEALARRGAGAAVIGPFVAGWVLFLPNAPYMATDVVHLSWSGRPATSDVVMFTAFAVTGVYLCLASAWFIRIALLPRWGARTAAWVVNGSLALCGVGIYLGRVVQVNSWEVVTGPARVVARVGAHVDRAHGFAEGLVIAGVSAAILVGSFHLVAWLAEPRQERPKG
jgi:uncharacterized membrane protein